MPDNGEVCDADKVLSDSNARVQIDHHMPPASRNKYDFPRALKDLNLGGVSNTPELLNHRYSQVVLHAASHQNTDGVENPHIDPSTLTC